MICCQLVKEMLDQIYKNSNDEAMLEIDNRFISNFIQLDRYRHSLSSGLGLDHSDLWLRLAFVYRYLPCRASQLAQRLASCFHNNYLPPDKIVMTSLGCGPGTDLIGLIKALNNLDLSAQIVAYMFDMENGWKETFEKYLAPQPEFAGALTGSSVSTEWGNFDVADSSTWWLLPPGFYSSDLYITSYLLSEAFGRCSSAPSFYEELFSKAKKGSTFLFIDNNHSDYRPLYQQVSSLASDSDISGLQFEEAPQPWYPPSSESKDDLFPYPDRFNNRPLMASDFVWALGVKQ